MKKGRVGIKILQIQMFISYMDGYLFLMETVGSAQDNT